MQNKELSWLIGGPQGSGVDTAANIFARCSLILGLYLYGKREYHSNIKGEHSYFPIRVSNKVVRSHLERIDMLVALDGETIFRHAHNLTHNSAVIYDIMLNDKVLDDIPTIDNATKNRLSRFLTKKDKSVKEVLDTINVKKYPIPFNELLYKLAEKRGVPELSKLVRVINTMLVSSSLALLGVDINYIKEAINLSFKAKKSIVEVNIDAAEYAYNYTRSMYDVYTHLTNGSNKDLILVQGTQAAALGKISAGCRFQTYYPITPATDESEYLESNQIIRYTDGSNGSIVVVQTEDEIAAITMATGAALAGARASTSTSGPGFSLMVEGMGWAGMNEVPVVITLYQRAGPSTGLPTRHEQGDLLFAIHAGHGEFPRVVIASGDIEEIYYDTIRAFNYAEKYQMPVIHILDKALANSIITCKPFDQKRIKIDRGLLLEDVNDNYKRFELNGLISPRVRLGNKNGIFWNTGDEHDEFGHITEDPDNRSKMMEKRMGKLDLLLKEVSDEEKVTFYDNHSDLTIISWGSTKGAILDTLDLLRDEGIHINFIQVKLLYPFPGEYMNKLTKDSKLLIDVEVNYSAQLSRLLMSSIGRDTDYKIVKYNGRSIACDELYHVLKKILEGSNKRRWVLNHGV